MTQLLPLSLIVISFISSIILVKMMILIMTKLGIVDKPGDRRAHVKTTPRGGGFALVVIFYLLLPAFEYYNSGNFNKSVDILTIFTPISLVSLWDDISDIHIIIRLVIHILCSCLAVIWIIHPYKILHNELPLMIDFAIGSFALLSFLNIYNFLDGIDGITASESIHLSLTIIILCAIKGDIIPNIWLIITITSIILGYSCGFILFNWHPAKIFAGDIGTITVGFLLGVCLLIVASSSDRLFASCVIASLYYIADGGMTILIRLVNGEKIWQPHLQHFFQKAVKKGMAHDQVVLKIIKCNIILMLLSVSALFYPITSIIIALFTVTITLIKFLK